MELGFETGQQCPSQTVSLAMPTHQPSNHIHALELVDELVARTYRLPRSALYASTRCRKSVAFARQVAMYLGHVCLSYPLRDLAEHYQRDRTTVAYACRVVEDRREEEQIELLLNSLESALQTMMLVTPMTCTSPQ